MSGTSKILRGAAIALAMAAAIGAQSRLKPAVQKPALKPEPQPAVQAPVVKPAEAVLRTHLGEAGGPTDPPALRRGLAWIKQRAKVAVSGLRLTLADVAEIDALDPTTAAHLRTLDLGEIPARGRQLVLSRDTLLDTVSRLKLDEEFKWDGATVTQVDLRLFSLSGDEVEALGRRHIGRALGVNGSEARFGPAATPRGFECVAGRWSTRVFVRTAPDERFSGAVRLELVAVADGSERASVPFVIEVERKGRVLVASRDLTQGQPIKAEDVSPVERNLAAVGPDSVDMPERLVGMVLARRVQSGQVLTTRDFRLPPVIERDDVIQVRYRAGALKITGLGRAQSAGAPGERIPVVNLGSGKVVHAVVVDSRTVEIASGFSLP